MKIDQDKKEEWVLEIANYSRGGDSRDRGHGGIWDRGRGRHSRYQIECFKRHKIRHYQSECLTWHEYDANYVEYDESE